MTNENKQFEKNKIIKEEPKEIKSPNWIDKNKFKEILAIIDSNKFNYKNKIGEFKYIGIKDLVNNIRNNTISEISAKEGLNTLNEIKNAEMIKYKKHTLKQKELLNVFNDLLDKILTDKTLMSSNENENDKPLMPLKDVIENGNENENEHDKTMSSKEDDNETMNQNNNNTIKELNDSLDKIIDKSKSFEDQIKSIKKYKI